VVAGQRCARRTTRRIAALMLARTLQYTIAGGTYTLQQALRGAEKTACMDGETSRGGRTGERVASGEPQALVPNPTREDPKPYIRGALR
jgi:ABC-type phosphate transport system ATPase subunit